MFMTREVTTPIPLLESLLGILSQKTRLVEVSLWVDVDLNESLKILKKYLASKNLRKVEIKSSK